MATIYIKDRAELFNKVKGALHNLENFDVSYKGKSVRVTTGEDGYVMLEPHNERCVYDSRYIDDFLKEIVSDIKYTLFKNKNLVLITVINSKNKWFFDRRTRKIFYVSDGKIFNKTATEDSLYSYILEEAKEKMNIEGIIVDENYQLCENDLDVLEGTDIDKDYFRKCLIQRFKGKPYRKMMARLVLKDLQYSYKFFFNCDYCGKESFFWMKHNPMAFTDHWGPDFCCEECERKYYEEHKQEIAEQKRQWAETSKLLDLTIVSVNPPNPIRTEVFDEKPMALPTDKIHYVEAMMRRTRVNI
jgi:hypothetical protein